VVEPPEALWNEQLRLMVELDGVPLPRWDRKPSGAAGFGGWLLTRGAWYLALLSLGESLGEGEGRTHPALRPWQAATAPPGLAAVLDSVASALEAPEAPRELVGAAVALVARLRAVLGPLGAGGSPHRLERAAVVADEAALGVLSFASLAALRGDGIGTLGLKYLLEARRIAPQTVAAAAFAAFAQAGNPIEDVDIFAEPELAELLVPHAPPSVLSSLLPALERRLGAAALARLPIADAQWSQVFAAGGDVPVALFSFVPDGLVAAAVRAACASRNDDALAVLWRRFPTLLGGFVRSALTPAGAPGVELERLLSTIPESAAVGLIATLDDVDALLRARGASLMVLRRHLHRELTRLDPKAEAFRDTYALFDELERRCAKVVG
jgi:hypothetical protein